MTLEQLILEALAYRRHVGASLGDIRSYVGIREDTRHAASDDLAVLRRLEEAGSLVKVGKNWFLTPKGYKGASGSALEARWRGEDAWILLALIYNREKAGSRLADIIGTADAINHAIPSREELHGALNRLLAGRLIESKRDRFTITDRAVELFSKVEASCKESMQDQLDGLARIMDCPCCGVKLKGVRWQIDLDEPTFKGAVEPYSKSS
jgi:hypothetical protein